MLCAMLVLSACTQIVADEDKRTITVTGETTLEREPELFALAGAVRARAADRNEVLETLSDTLDTLRETLTDLRGLERLAFTTEDMTVTPVRPYGCDANFRGEQRPRDCAPIAHMAVIPFEVVGGPYQVAGDAASLLAEKGADDVRVIGFTVADPDGLRAEARRQAVLEGLQTAQELASGAGARLGPVIAVRYGDVYADGLVTRARAPEELDVSGLRTSPAAPIRLTPDAIKVRETVHLEIQLLDVDGAG